jgi:hypothetical protein
MLESDRPLDLLYAVRDVGLTPLQFDALRAQVQTAVDREIERELRGPKVAGGRATRRAPRLTFGTVVTTLGVVVSIAVAVTAITLLSHGRGSTRSGGPTASQLMAKLAVLSRPQTRADMLPARPRITDPEGNIIPGFTRLVRVLPDARIFLVVTTPNARSNNSTWSPKLGDQVAIVEISDGHASETTPIPAVDLTNGNDINGINPTPHRPALRRGASHGGGLPRGAYLVAIVPDGVARVRWTFLTEPSKADVTLDLSVVNNVVVARRPDTSPGPVRTAWYAADGQRVPTSNRPLLAAQAKIDTGQRAQAIRYDLHHAHSADPSLLRAFAVFAITSRTAVKTAAGDIISHPEFSSLPLDVVQGGMWIHVPVQLDPSQVREVITPSGARVYVIPGRRGICLVASGGGAACNVLPGAETQGLTMTQSSFDAPTTIYKLVPKTIHSITVRLNGGARTIRVPDGIYVGSS